MTHEPVRIKVDPASEFGRVVAQAATAVVVLESDGVAYRLVLEEDDVFTNDDPERVLQGLRRSRGALKGVDTQELLRDLREQREQREQDSTGRPA